MTQDDYAKLIDNVPEAVREKFNVMSEEIVNAIGIIFGYNYIPDGLLADILISGAVAMYEVLNPTREDLQYV